MTVPPCPGQHSEMLQWEGPWAPGPGNPGEFYAWFSYTIAPGVLLYWLDVNTLNDGVGPFDSWLQVTAESGSQ